MKFESCLFLAEISCIVIGSLTIEFILNFQYKSKQSMYIQDKLFPPLLASLMTERRQALIMGGAVGLQFGLATAGLPGWVCPFKAVFGIPCPGCGLSTATSLLLHGQWHAAMTTHAFAPIFLAGTLLILGVSLLPEPLRSQAIQSVSMLEKRTGVTALIMLGLLFYWGFRLLWL